MTDQEQDIKQIATTLLAGMLSNPHIYPMVSNDEARGQREQILVSTAITMAEQLVEKVENSYGNQR